VVLTANHRHKIDRHLVTVRLHMTRLAQRQPKSDDRVYDEQSTKYDGEWMHINALSYR
jgi:hypothetical protein